MDFPPKTEREIVEENLIPDGTECDATITAAKDDVSKKGNDMISLTLRVYRDDGRTKEMRDWLLPSIPMKLLRFCESAGLKERYEAGQLQAADCVDRDVRVVVSIQKDKTGEYPDQNSIKAYKARGPEAAASPVSEKKEFAEADIPF